MGRTNLCALIIYVTVMMMMIEVHSSLHRVGGGKFSWTPNVNFSEWSSHQRFYSGDWLFFGFDKTNHSILQVNKSSYEKCNETNYIFNLTRGGRDVFQLLEPKPYYFICGRGYCVKGMKLAVNVLPQPPPSSLTATQTSTAIPLITANAFTAISTVILILASKTLYF